MIPSFSQVSACHRRVRRHMSPVRDALVTSVTNVGGEEEEEEEAAEGEEPEPPVRWKMSQLSTVPKQSLPGCLDASLTAGTFSRSQSILYAEK